MYSVYGDSYLPPSYPQGLKADTLGITTSCPQQAVEERKAVSWQGKGLKEVKQVAKEALSGALVGSICAGIAAGTILLRPLSSCGNQEICLAILLVLPFKNLLPQAKAIKASHNEAKQFGPNAKCFRNMQASWLAKSANRVPLIEQKLTNENKREAATWELQAMIEQQIPIACYETVTMEQQDSLNANGRLSDEKIKDLFDVFVQDSKATAAQIIAGTLGLLAALKSMEALAPDNGLADSQLIVKFAVANMVASVSRGLFKRHAFPRLPSAEQVAETAQSFFTKTVRPASPKEIV